MRKRELRRYIKLLTYIFSFVGVILLIYLSLPFYYDYEKNKLAILKKISNDFSLNINFNSKANYSFFPSPRINLYDAEILSFSNVYNKIGTAKKIILKIPFRNLVNLQMLKFYSAELFNAEINIQYSEIRDFIKYIKKKEYKNPMQFHKSKINFINKGKLISSVDIKKLNILNKDLINQIQLEGNVFNNKVKIEYQNRNFDKKPTSIVSIELPEIGLRLNSNINYNKQDRLYYGKSRVTYPKNQFYFEYKFNKKALNVYSSKIGGNFFKGELLGEVMFVPFLFFDLKLNIDHFAFTKFMNNTFKQNKNFLAQFIPPSKKMNGKININIDVIKSSSKIINSLTAIVEFKNGVIIIKEINLNFNKFGTMKVAGELLEQKNDKIFNFNSDINITNSKIFYSRFLIPKRKRIIIEPINVIGKIDLNTYEINLEELDYEKKINDDELLNLNEIINNNISRKIRKGFFEQSNLRKMIQSLFR